jgi:cathepsin B
MAMLCSALGVHPDRAAQIELLKNTPGVLWKVSAHPRFASDAPGASKSLCGVKAGWERSMDKAIEDGSVKLQKTLLGASINAPDDFDSAVKWPHCAKLIADIRDQSNCGCCWAFAGAEAASDRMCIATNASILVPLSAQDVCFCGSDDGCNGGFVQEPWMYIQESGAVTGGQYQGSGPFGKGMCSNYAFPHCHHHGPKGQDPYPAEGEPGCPSQKSAKCPASCDATASEDHADFKADKYSYRGDTIAAEGEAGIMQAIMTGGPVETAFDVYSDFENYAGGIYHHVAGDNVGGHAVKMVGWGVEDGTKYWKVANSWNPYWGEKGYFRIKRGNNEGGIEDSVVGSDLSSKWSKKSEQHTDAVVV